MNWIVGHVVRARNEALGLLGETPLFDDADFDAYGPGVTVSTMLCLDELRRRFDALGPALDADLIRDFDDEFIVAGEADADECAAEAPVPAHAG